MARLSPFTCALAAAMLAGGCAKHVARESWQPLALGSDAEFSGMWFADSLNGWIVGGGPFVAGGIVGRTRDGGETWSFASGLATPEPGASRFSLEAIRFTSPNHGIVTADGGKIFLTDDGGENWRLVRYGRGLTDHLFDLDFLDESNGWAVGLLGVLRTRDRGETWQEVHRSDPYASDGAGHAIDMIDWRNGWIAGREGLQRTYDGGENWVPAPLPLDPNEHLQLWDITFVDDLNGWAVGEEGTILHTTNGGDAWVLQDTGLADAKSKPVAEHIQRRIGVIDTLDLGERTPALCLTSVRFVDAQNGWVAGHYGPGGGRSVLLRTTDGGATWQVDAKAEGESLMSLFVLDRDHAWAIGDRVREGTHVVLRHAPTAESSSSSVKI